MITCVQCNAQNLETRHFCGQCGIKMVFSCPQCHFINHSGDHFCGGCGSSFSAPPSPKNFLKESVPTQGTSIPQVKKNSSHSNKAILDYINVQKGSKGKKVQVKDEKKQISQDEIERLIHESLEKGND